LIIFVLPNNHTMANTDFDLKSGKEELAFNDFILHAEDLMRIQIYRNAREYYFKALETNFNNQLASQKIAECNALIKSESKVILIIVSIISIAALIIIFG